MKYAGLTCILCACTLSGCFASAKLRQTVEQIRILRRLLSAICTELQHTLPFVPDLLCFLAGQAAFRELVFLQEAAANAENYPECWDKALQHDSCLTEPVRDILKTVGQTLGSTTLEGQLSALTLCQEQLREIELDAEQKARQRGNLYCKFGLLAGCFISILLL